MDDEKYKLKNYCFNIRNFIKNEKCSKLITKSKKKDKLIKK